MRTNDLRLKVLNVLSFGYCVLVAQSLQRIFLFRDQHIKSLGLSWKEMLFDLRVAWLIHQDGLRSTLLLQILLWHFFSYDLVFHMLEITWLFQVLLITTCGWKLWLLVIVNRINQIVDIILEEVADGRFKYLLENVIRQLVIHLLLNLLERKFVLHVQGVRLVVPWLGRFRALEIPMDNFLGAAHKIVIAF